MAVEIKTRDPRLRLSPATPSPVTCTQDLRRAPLLWAPDRGGFRAPVTPTARDPLVPRRLTERTGRGHTDETPGVCVWGGLSRLFHFRSPRGRECGLRGRAFPCPRTLVLMSGLLFCVSSSVSFYFRRPRTSVGTWVTLSQSYRLDWVPSPAHPPTHTHDPYVQAPQGVRLLGSP